MSRVIAVAVVREDPPRVFIAEDQETLNWVLALPLIARTSPTELGPTLTGRLREALLNEQWSDAVSIWMSHFGAVVDVYPSESFHERQVVEMDAEELQVSPIFQE